MKGHSIRKVDNHHLRATLPEALVNVGARNRTLVLWEVKQALLTTKPFLQLPNLHFLEEITMEMFPSPFQSNYVQSRNKPVVFNGQVRFPGQLIH